MNLSFTLFKANQLSNTPKLLQFLPPLTYKPYLLLMITTILLTLYATGSVSMLLLYLFGLFLADILTLNQYKHKEKTHILAILAVIFWPFYLIIFTFKSAFNQPK